MTKKLLIATHNADKVKEFRSILTGLDLILVSPDEAGSFPPTVEDAETLQGNALKKALEAYRATGIPAVADDTGLEVFYLNDEPGVYSSRYSGPGATYASNRKKLLRNLRGVPPRRRAAQFRCVVAFVPAAGVQHFFEGRCQGAITEHESGDGGFGYDPVFLPDGFGETFGEMAPDKKNTLSHRAHALQAFAEFLRRGGW